MLINSGVPCGRQKRSRLKTLIPSAGALKGNLARETSTKAPKASNEAVGKT